MRMYVIDYARKWKLGTTCLMNFLGMFGIVVAAWAFMVLVGSKVPQHARETVLMRGDDVLAVHWAGLFPPHWSLLTVHTVVPRSITGDHS